MGFAKDPFAKYEQMGREFSADEKILSISEAYEAAEAEEQKKLEAIHSAKAVVELSVDDLSENPDNHFQELTGDCFEELCASIRKQGIINPIIVREIDGESRYRIIAGHNRVRAAKECGLETVPAIIKDVDEVEEAIILADSNIQREEVTDLEKGWAYRTIYEAIARSGQGKRNDKLSSHDGTEVQNELSSHDGTEVVKAVDGKRSDEIIAERYGIGRNTVLRKIRLTYLDRELYTLYEKKAFSQQAAEHLSYLRPSEQVQCVNCIEQGLKIDVEIAKAVKEESKAIPDGEGAAPLSDKDILRIAEDVKKARKEEKQEGEKEREKQKKNRKYSIGEELFPPQLKKSERESYISKALAYILENNIKLS